MQRPLYLKFKSKFYIFILSMIHVLGLSFLISCTSNGSNSGKDKTTDSLKRVKEVNDSIDKANKEKHKKDSIAQIKNTQDSIAREDSINKIKMNKNRYKPDSPKCMYGIAPNFEKK